MTWWLIFVWLFAQLLILFVQLELGGALTIP